MKTIPIHAEPVPGLTLVGCGILRKEVDFLIEKNHWGIHTHFLDSALHNYFNRLSNELNAALSEHEQAGDKTLVFYGCCHPLMNEFIENHHTHRVSGQNCITMLLGYDLFMKELEKGAYFLLQDWALSWKPMITECFGGNLTIIREIFHTSHKYMLALKTPCNEDFTEAATTAAEFVDLPLQWMDVDLTHLEKVLADAIALIKQESP